MQRNVSLATKSITLIALAFLLPLTGKAQKAKEHARTPGFPFDGNKPSLNTPLQLTKRNHTFVPVRVNNSEPLWFVLDSGSANTLLNKRLVKNLNLKLLKRSANRKVQVKERKKPF